MCIEPPRPPEQPSTLPEELGHDVLGRRAADDGVAVGAIGGDQVVGLAQRARGADDRGLLADGQVQEAADLGTSVHLAGALLEATDEDHRLEPLARDRRARAGWASALHGTPARDELGRVELVQIAAQRAREPGGGLRRSVPEEDGFAAVDLDDLDVVDAIGVGEQCRARARRA